MSEPVYTESGLKKLGELFASRRNGIEYRAFSEISGISTAHIRRIEEGEATDIGPKILAKIAKVTDRTIEEVIAIACSRDIQVAESTLTGPEIEKLIIRFLPEAEIWMVAGNLYKYLEKLRACQVVDEAQNDNQI